jgi:hypothetical protein
MARTYILGGLVLACVAYLAERKMNVARNDMAEAKDKIAHISQQPSSRPGRDPTKGAVPSAPAPGTAWDRQADQEAEQSWRSATGAGDAERKAHLTKGTFTVVDGTIVYGPDAQLDIGHGMMVSSPTGVMVSDVDQRHFAGDLVIESQNGTRTTTAENAFISLDGAHVEMTSDSAVTEKRDAPEP